MDEQPDTFQNAVDAYLKEEPPEAPAPVVEGAVAEAPEIEEKPEEAQKPARASGVEASEEKKPDDFVEFTTPEQKERFNKVFGYAKRLERQYQEQQTINQRMQEQLLAQQKPQRFEEVPAPQPFKQSPPKLEDYETANEWGEALSEWAAKQAETTYESRSTRDRARQEQEYHQAKLVNHLTAKTNEGYQRFGQIAFDNACSEVVNFAPPGSNMHSTLFSLNLYSDVVVELAKNLQEADRISRLPSNDQIYELKSMERRLMNKGELAQKVLTKTQIKVEAPGAGQDLQKSPSLNKLKQHAISTGHIKDFAKIFEADSTL